MNFGVLFYFKYAQFSWDNLRLVFEAIGIPFAERSFDILLPAGISFFVFQAVGYTIDVYRGDIYAERSLLCCALFVSFFPQLVAGPIERSKNLLKQLDKTYSCSFEGEGKLELLFPFSLYHSRWNELTEEDFRPQYSLFYGVEPRYNVGTPKSEIIHRSEGRPAPERGERSISRPYKEALRRFRNHTRPDQHPLLLLSGLPAGGERRLSIRTGAGYSICKLHE